jgi:hypothetical protein
VSPVKYELGLYIPEEAILERTNRSAILKYVRMSGTVDLVGSWQTPCHQC